MAGYTAFLSGMHRFLAAASQAVDGGGAFDDARDTLAADLAVLGLTPSPSTRVAHAAPAAAMGWRYVVAGSALGARVILPRARALGLDAGRGARYLSAQAAGGDWPALLAQLDRMPDEDADAAIAGAHDAFACAEACMADAFQTQAA